MRAHRITVHGAALFLAVAVLAVVPQRVRGDAGSVLGAIEVDDDFSVVTLRGDFGPGAPLVSVGGKAAQLLTNDGTFIAAKIPRTLQSGKHPVVVTTFDGRSASIDVEFVPGAAWSAGQGKPREAIVDAATVNEDRSAVFLSGHFGEGMPTIRCEGKRLQPLTNDGTFLAAKLPTGMRPGTYTVVVKRADAGAATIRLVVP